MANLKGSKTEENLKAAFAGESQANRRYLYFAQKADVEGQNEVSALFRSTAEGETGHAHGHLEYLAQVGDPATGEPIGAEFVWLRLLIGFDIIFTALAATLVALALVELALPWLRQFLDAGIPLHDLGRDGILPPAVGLTLLVGLVGGLYPAFGVFGINAHYAIAARRHMAMYGTTNLPT